jgi:hypothetical protein
MTPRSTASVGSRGASSLDERRAQRADLHAALEAHVDNPDPIIDWLKDKGFLQFVQAAPDSVYDRNGYAVPRTRALYVYNRPREQR